MSALQNTLASIPAKWKNRVLVSAGVIGGLWLAGWLGVPPLLKWQLEQQGSELLGRTVTVDKVDFRPWSLELSLEGLRVAQADGKTPQLSIERLYIDAELQSLLRLAPVIDAVNVKQPHVVLHQLAPGRFDIDDVIQRLDKPDDGSPTPRFAVFNITLNDGAVDFVDDTVEQTHEVRQLLLTVPFLSNLASRREVVTEPRLAFTLNGSPFDSHAASTPFAQTHHTRATLRIDDFDLTRYRAYWPKSLPVQLGSGHLQTDLQLEFEQQDTPRVTISGSVNLDGWQLQEALPGQDTNKPLALLGWKRLHLAFDNTEPLQQHLRLQQIAWDEPQFNVRRAGNGELHLARIAQALARPAKPPAASATDTSQTPDTPANPWQLDLAQFQLKGGQVLWQDASTRPAAELALHDLNLSTGRLTWPVQEPVKLEGSARLQNTPLHWSGQASDQTAQLDLTLDPLPLALARPYAATALKPELSGLLSAEAQLNWAAAKDGQAAQTQVRLARLTLQDMALRSGKQTLAGVKNLLGENIELDLGQQTVKIGKLQIDQPQAQLGRDALGHWAHEAWLVQTKPATTPAPAGNTQAAPWRVSLQALSLNNGEGRWDDASPSRPVRLNLSGLNLQSGPLQFPATQAVATPLSVSLRLADATAPRNDPGRIRYQGKLQLPLVNPKTPSARTSLSTQGSLNIDHLPLHALEPYFAESLNLELLRADTSYRGQFQFGLPPDGLSLQVKGDVAIEDLHASTLSPAEELLDWKALNLRGVNVQVGAGQLRRLSVDETVLSDYYARVIVHPNGHINLQDLVRHADSAAPANDAAPSVGATTAANTDAAAPAPDIRFGPISLVNGRVNFSDYFIQPNYSANLSQLTGSLGSFSNAATTAGQPPQLAELTLKGRVEGTASLDVTGKLNPLATPLALDIKASARELELPPLSPYTLKYAGHGIERGKLSMDVSYRIEPSGQLSASNQIILNQLRFGDRDPGSTAPNLPLKLAVALLADSDGVIDINLPISGSLNDPQFRVGPIIVKLIFNLIGKAITSPFSLIAHAFGGGGEELNHITFAPGSATLSEVSRQKLDGVAKAMASRPALQLTITGESDLDAERNGYRQTRLNDMLLAEKRRQLARAGEALGGVTSYKPEERSALLKEVYRRADMPKPRNLVGMAKDLPDAEMEALLLASIPVSADTIRELAVARGTTVKDYLAGQQVNPSRMFLGQIQPKRDSDAWEPGTELSLSTGQ